jgi:hypothetical protein
MTRSFHVENHQWFVSASPFFCCWILPLFLPNFMVSNCCSSYYLVSSLQLLYGLGRDEGWKSSSDTQPSQPYCFLTQHTSNPEASRTNVSEATLCTVHLATWVSTHCTQPATGVTGAQWDKDIPNDHAFPNPDNARPIVRRPTDLPVTAGYDRAWARTQGLWWHSWHWAPLTTAPPGRPSASSWYHGLVLRSLNWCHICANMPKISLLANQQL